MQTDSNTAVADVADMLKTARALAFRLEDEGVDPFLDWEARLELAALAREIVDGLKQIEQPAAA
jgi:hypothetical protein